MEENDDGDDNHAPPDDKQPESFRVSVVSLFRSVVAQDFSYIHGSGSEMFVLCQLLKKLGTTH